MIAHCPACGTHFKHQIVAVPARARCGRCDAAVDLSRLRPYRIIAASAPRAADGGFPIGLDDPSLATQIAGRVSHAPSTPAASTPMQETPEPVATPIALSRVDDTWNTDDPLPAIPEMTATDRDILGSHHVADADGVAPTPAQPEGRWMTFALWLLTGAIVGTGVSWTLGGTTEWGVGAGSIAGSVMGWTWLRWMSPK